MVLSKGVWVDEVSPPLDFIVVVIEGFPFDVLVFPSENLVPYVEVVSGLLIGYWFHKSSNLVIVITLADSSPPQNHLDNLLYRSVALVFKPTVDR